jgi:hypothetical protein
MEKLSLGARCELAADRSINQVCTCLLLLLLVVAGWFAGLTTTMTNIFSYIQYKLVDYIALAMIANETITTLQHSNKHTCTLYNETIHL